MISILGFGNSLTAGFGLPSGASFVDQLQDELDRANLHQKVRIINAGISGETTGGGLFRIDRALAVSPDLVILELGANDSLLGYPAEEVKQNLEIMIQKSLAKGSRVLLAGIRPPLEHTPGYCEAYSAIYQELAEEYGLRLYPDFLQGVLYQSDLTLPDGIHPNAKGVAVIVANIAPVVLACLDLGETGE